MTTYKSNKLIAVLQAALGLFFIVFSIVVLKLELTSYIFIGFGLLMLVMAYVTSKAIIDLSGSTLTSHYWRAQSINLKELAAVQSGQFGSNSGGTILFIDKNGQQLTFIPSIFRRRDVKTLLNQILPYFPQPVSALPLLVRLRLRVYGIK